MSICLKWSSTVFENIKISSRYAWAKSSYPRKTIDINSWKMPGAFVGLNDITLKWNKPLRQVNALFSLSSSWSLTCLFPDFKSSFEKYLADPSDASISSMPGSGRAYFFVILLSTLKSTQNLLVPFFFSTKTIGKPTGYWTSQLRLPASFHRLLNQSSFFEGCAIWAFFVVTKKQDLISFCSLSISVLNSSGACTCSKSTSGLLLFCLSGIVISVILPALSDLAVGLQGNRLVCIIHY